MGEAWADIASLLKQHKLLAMKSIQQQIMALDNPLEVIAAAGPLNYSSTMLDDSMLQAMIEHSGGSKENVANPSHNEPSAISQAPQDLARTVAPLSQPEPLDIKFSPSPHMRLLI